MNERDLFLIADISGFTPQIGRLVSMMNYVRYTTLSAVEGLGVDHVFGHELNHRGQIRWLRSRATRRL